MQNFKRVLALVLSLMMVATMFGGAISASAAEDEINAVFSAMEANATLVGQSYSLVEGLDGNAQQCTLGGEMFIFIYNDTRTNPPLDIYYATHMVFDLWVSDGAAFSAAMQAAADCGINLDDADHESQWGNSGGFVERDSALKPAMANLKDGWNHIVLPLNAESECWNLASLRFYAVGTSFAGITIAFDDIRFVDQLALDDTIAKRTVAKDATIAISALPAVNDITLANEAAVEAAATAFNAVDADYVNVVKDAAKLEAAVAKIAALKEAAGDAANQEAADVVTAQIAALNVQSLDDKAAVEAARAAYEALTKGQKALVTNLAALEAAEAAIKALTPVDAQFRALDVHKDVAWVNTDGGALAGEHLEGGDALKVTIAGDTPLLHTYSNGQASNPINVAGATHIAFDLWVEDGAAFSAAAQAAGDCGVNMDDTNNMNAWGESGGKVDAPQFKAALANLKDGWNHVVAPLRAETACTNLGDIRIYWAGASKMIGMTIILDDIRFVNQAALNGAYADRTAAKDATIAIKAIPALDAITVEDQAIVTAAAEAFAAVKDEYKPLVQNVEAIAAAQAKIDELNTPVVTYTFDGDSFYEDGELVQAYQVIDFEGCVYFVSDYNKVAKNCTLYLGEKFIDEPGYYTFDAQGRAVDFSGVRDGYVFIHNVMQKAYQVVTVNGAQYFINDGNKVATNCTLYLTTAFVETPGYYSFDAEGKMSAATGILNGKYYENGTVARLYELVEVDGVTYFVNDGYNVAKDCVLYLGEKFAPGAAGWYTFDATGAVVNYIA